MNVTQIQKPQTAPAAAAPAKRRMSLANATKGRIASPFRVLLYGDEKLGKSTFAAGAPGAVWIGRDSGTEHLDITRYPQPETWREVLEALEDVTANGAANGVKSIVIDPLGWFEPLVANDVTNGEIVNTKTWGGGFGAYGNAIRDRWRLFFSVLERAWKSGLNVILIAHATTKKFEDPEGPAYDRYELALDSKELAGMAKQWVDAILFAKREVYGKTDASTKKTKAAGGGAHMLYTKASPAYVAGNRWTLPDPLPLSWPAFAEALERGQQRVDELRAQIETGLADLGDAEVAKKVRGWLDSNAFELEDIANAVAVKLTERRASQGVSGETKEG